MAEHSLTPVVAETHFASQTRTCGEDGILNVDHNVDQLWHFYEAMTLVRDPKKEESAFTKSSVIFQLPFHGSPQRLIVHGDGWRSMDAYLDYPTQGRMMLWRIFCYNDGKPVYDHLPIFGDTLESLTAHYTTELSPFLKTPENPLDCNRRYSFQRGFIDSDTLLVEARNREDRPTQELELRYLPDPRKGEPRSFMTLKADERVVWRSLALDQRVAHYRRPVAVVMSGR